MQEGPAALRIGYGTAEDPGLLQCQIAIDQHLRAAVQAGREGRKLCVVRQRRAEPMQEIAERGVVRVAQHKGMRERVGERSDADLQRSAVLD